MLVREVLNRDEWEVMEAAQRPFTNPGYYEHISLKRWPAFLASSREIIRALLLPNDGVQSARVESK